MLLYVGKRVRWMIVCNERLSLNEDAFCKTILNCISVTESIILENDYLNLNVKGKMKTNTQIS